MATTNTTAETITTELFIKEKIRNFISYIEKTIGKENKLYPQIVQLRDDEKMIFRYVGVVQSIAELKNGKYSVPEDRVREYLEKVVEKKLDDEFIKKVQRYLEMFLNVLK